MKKTALTIALLAGTSMLAIGAGNVQAAETKATASGGSTVELNEAEKTDVTSEEIKEGAEAAADKTGEALAATGKAASDASVALEAQVRELFSSDDIQSIEGVAVRDAKGEAIGEVDGVVRDRTSGETYFVVDVGGFLGLGEKEVAVPSNRFTVGDSHLKLASMTKADLETHDEFDPDLYSPVAVSATGDVTVQ